MVDAWDVDAPVLHDVAHLGIVAAAAVATWWPGERTVRRLGAAGVLGLVLLWLGSVLVHLPQGQAVVSVSWAITGIALLVVGATRKLRDVAAAALVVIGLTVGKLLTVDLREVDALWRAGLFLVVGLGLLRLGFLLPALTASDDDDDSDASPTNHTRGPVAAPAATACGGARDVVGSVAGGSRSTVVPTFAACGGLRRSPSLRFGAATPRY